MAATIISQTFANKTNPSSAYALRTGAILDIVFKGFGVNIVELPRSRHLKPPRPRENNHILVDGIAHGPFNEMGNNEVYKFTINSDNPNRMEGFEKWSFPNVLTIDGKHVRLFRKSGSQFFNYEITFPLFY